MAVKKKKSPVKKSTTKKKKAEVIPASLVWMRSPKGHDVITLNETDYLSFGKSGNAKWMHLSYIDRDGVRRGEMLPVAFAAMKTEFQTIIGVKNFQLLKEVLREVVVDDVIPRDKFSVIGEILKSHGCE